MKPGWTMAAMMLVAAAPLAAQQAASPVTRALADPARADQQGDDARRQAAAVLQFAGVKPGDVVVDYLPGSGYWTRIFSGVVGANGHVYAYWPAAESTFVVSSPMFVISVVLTASAPSGRAPARCRARVRSRRRRVA